MKYFNYLPQHVDRGKISSEHDIRQKWVNQQKKGFLRYRTPFESLQQYTHGSVDCSGDAITIGRSEEISESDQSLIRTHLKAFMPWRKGPYSIFGIDLVPERRRRPRRDPGDLPRRRRQDGHQGQVDDRRGDRDQRQSGGQRHHTHRD